MRLIKRYSNRKLYDSIDKKYITLEKVESFIKAGEKVRIVDNTTGEDMTTATLSQIIAEQAKKQRSYSPSLFIQMIRKGKGSMYDYLRKTINTIGEMAYFIEEEIESKVKQLISSGEITEEEGVALQNDLKKHQATQGQRVEKHVEALVSTVLQKLNIPKKADVDRLRMSIEKLEQRLEKLGEAEASSEDKGG